MGERAEDVRTRLDAFAELAEGWDSYGGHAITPEAIAAAHVLLDSINVVPTCNGGVTVDLASEGMSVEVDKHGVVVDVCMFFDDVRQYVAAVTLRRAGEPTRGAGASKPCPDPTGQPGTTEPTPVSRPDVSRGRGAHGSQPVGPDR